ncbi:Tannase/feruloyl esterase [Microdochium trichocladiopsis]|uniref:Carboxylic ester hydrolase n=1 Tax=Microdochium trichocladiopsis TaxID=1682393 RepID=A0A9P8YFR7_9PEZI|nr:Tannase/feruloyl esterase [Microdochium trichocladiopsis]KAH7038404.1 Tannase/feruloyl esterase [Microdochium trichocladiopsis]
MTGLASSTSTGGAASSLWVAKCVHKSYVFPNATLVSVDALPSGSVIQLPYGPDLCANAGVTATATSDLCRVVVNITDTPGSSIRIDAWLPADWNGRFLATGNGGIGGCIDYSGLQTGAQLGFATLGTNAGHDGEVGFDFFLNQPAVINDFGYRAIHVEAEFGKQLIQHFYGRAPATSYYHGCSTGGRQGLQNAQLYPADFDGVLAGAPGIDWLHIVASKGILARRIGWPDLTSSAYVRPEQWRAIVAHQIALFDPLDGLADGIIDDPARFRYDPALAACGGTALNSSLCLEPDQVAAVRAAYEPLTDGSGAIVYPGFSVGADTSVFSANQLNGTARLSYRVLDDFWRGAVYNDSTWDSLNFTVDDMDFAIHLNPGGVGFRETDFSATHARGVKIMSYHGQADQTITPALSAEYFTKVQASTGLDATAMADFYRLFFVPGMGHCSGGIGATDIGQKYPLDPTRVDADNNVLLALVDWVEKGKAPDMIFGARYASGNVLQPILASRKHCPYPQRSKWNGVTNSNLSTSWDCVF